MEWSNQQAKALQSIQKWLKDPKGRQVYKLFGYAGTGKTTLAKEAAKFVRGAVLYAAYTGKAALVMRSKGCDGAQTLHSLIYRFTQNQQTGKFYQYLDTYSELAYADLLIVDEGSWVDVKMGKDIESFGKRILVLGDPGQVPPVEGTGYWINQEPDTLLTDIHRQAAESPIIRLSVMAREGQVIQPGTYGNCLVVKREDVDKDQMAEIALGADQILAGKNDTRKGFNKRLRQLLGRAGDKHTWHPVEGDRLVCLKNNHERQLLNGSIWDVTQTLDMHENVNLACVSLDMPETVEELITVPEQFFSGTEQNLDWRILRNFEQFTYGYCLTVHKAQGSEWPNVLLYDESQSFSQIQRKHLYTGITRAAEKLTIIL